MLKERIPATLRIASQADSTRILTTVLIMLFSALAGAIAPVLWWIAVPLFVATGIGGVLLSDQYARKNRAVGTLEGLMKHSKDIDELRTEFAEVLAIEKLTIDELTRRYHELDKQLKSRNIEYERLEARCDEQARQLDKVL